MLLIFVNDMPQAVNWKKKLYGYESCLMYQRKSFEEIKKRLNNDFESIYDWFVHNRLSLHFGEDKTKCILFA